MYLCGFLSDRWFDLARIRSSIPVIKVDNSRLLGIGGKDVRYNNDHIIKHTDMLLKTTVVQTPHPLHDSVSGYTANLFTFYLRVHKLDFRVRKSLVQCYVQPVLFYESEA